MYKHSEKTTQTTVNSRWHYREDATALRGVEIISNGPVIEIYSNSSAHAVDLTFDVYD